MRDKQRFSAWLLPSPSFFLLFPLIHEPWITHYVSYSDLSLSRTGNIFFFSPNPFYNSLIISVHLVLKFSWFFFFFLFCFNEDVFQAAIPEANSKMFSQHHLNKNILLCKINRSNAWIRKSLSTHQYHIFNNKHVSWNYSGYYTGVQEKSRINLSCSITECLGSWECQFMFLDPRYEQIVVKDPWVWQHFLPFPSFKPFYIDNGPGITSPDDLMRKTIQW